MGYQESYIQFENAEVLKSEVAKYLERDDSEDQATMAGIVRVKKPFHVYSEGELLLVVAGERHPQRSNDHLREGLGIENVKSIVFIDNLSPLVEEANYDYFNDYLKDHTHILTEEEEEQFMNAKPVLEVEFNDEFRCSCGNTSFQDGIYPCDRHGIHCEPTENWERHYKCEACNQVYLDIEEVV